MSWDVGVGYHGSTHNYTYNVAPMLHAAGLDIRSLSRVRVTRAVKLLRRTITELERHAARYEALNPENGWGDRAGCVRWLQAIAADCQEAIDAGWGDERLYVG